jgi:hypothetical protein
MRVAVRGFQVQHNVERLITKRKLLGVPVDKGDIRQLMDRTAKPQITLASINAKDALGLRVF